MKKYMKSFFQIGSGTLIGMVISLLTAPIITRLVLPAEYGEYSIFITYSNIAVMIFCLGLDQGLVRFYYEQDTLEYKRSLVKEVTKYPILITSIFGIGIGVISRINLINKYFNNRFLILLFIYIFIQVVYRFAMLIVRLEQHSKLYSGLTIMNKLFYVLFAFIFIHFLGGYSYSLMISMIIATFIALLYSIQRERNIWNFSFKKESSVAIPTTELIRYSFPFIITMGLTTIFQANSKLFLDYFDTAETVGIYSSAQSITAIIGVIQTTFNTIWAPISLENYTNNPENKRFYSLGNKAITIIMFLVGFTAIFFKDLLILLLGDSYRDASYILPMLLLGPIMNTISETTVLGLVFKKKSKIQLMISVFTFIFSVIANFVFINWLSGIGAAIATGISYILFFSLRTYFSNKYYYIEFQLSKIYLLVSIFVAFALYASFNSFNYIYIVLYMISMLSIFYLYQDTIKEIIEYIMEKLNAIRN